MSFDALKLLGKRNAFTIFEMDLDINDPSLDATFAIQADSYGTPKTTDDPLAYTGVDFRTYSYADQQIFGLNHFPGLVSAKSNPPKIDPGKSIGFRATGRITLKDFVTDDTFELPPPYNDSRMVTGSHFRKLMARNHLYNRRARIIRGYNPEQYDSANTQVESYLIDSFSGPNDQGDVSFSLVDELILTESKKAKAPLVSSGELSVGISDVDTTLSFTSPITDEYGAVSATGYIAIEKEIMAYTVATSTTMTIVRAQFGTTAKEHSSGETIQKCLVFDNENIIDTITSLITNYTKIPSSYIPTADWDALKSGDLSQINLTRAIHKPVEVKKLINELVTLAGLSMYVDVIQNELVIVTAPDFASPVITFDEVEHLEIDTIKAEPNEKEQVTRQTILWDKFSATESNEDQNFRKTFQVIDGIAEGDADTSLVSEGKTVKSEWLVNSVEDNSIATSFAQRMINRFSQVPFEVSFDVDQRYIDTVTGGRMWLGSIFDIETNKIVDGGLNPVTTTCQCTQIKPARKDGQWTVSGFSYIAAAPISADLFITDDKTDYLLTDDLTTTEAKEYVVVINSGVKICASSTATASFRQGSFFAGATLKLINLGQILGYGGDGGDGGDAEVEAGPTCIINAGSSGAIGGDALDITTDVTIDNGFGLIYSGGSGGDGGSSECPSFNGGSGGGGGQGCQGGLGGSGGLAILTGSDGADGDAGSISGPGAPNGNVWGVGGSKAIELNGNTVTIIAGNNSEQIKGDVS